MIDSLDVWNKERESKLLIWLNASNLLKIGELFHKTFDETFDIN